MILNMMFYCLYIVFWYLWLICHVAYIALDFYKDPPAMFHFIQINNFIRLN